MLTKHKIKDFSYLLILWYGCQLSLPSTLSKPKCEIKKTFYTYIKNNFLLKETVSYTCPTLRKKCPCSFKN